MARIHLQFFFEQYYFLIGVLGAVILAEISPWFGSLEGPLYTHISAKYVAVSLIYFSSGVSIRDSDLLFYFMHFKTHIFVQVFSFIFAPIIVRLTLFVFVFPFDVDKWIATGMIAASCMPPPRSTAITLTKAAKGNEAIAMFNASLGTVLGIFLTPMALLMHVGVSTTLPIHTTLICLGCTVALPVILGQLAQKYIHRPWFRLNCFSEPALLFIVYTTFCDMFLHNDFAINTLTLLLTLAIILVVQLLLMFLSIRGSLVFLYTKRNFDAHDVVAIAFCCTQKSLVLGLPLLRTLYQGYSFLSEISLPLLLYHPVQLILGGLVCPHATSWLSKHFKTQRIENAA